MFISYDNLLYNDKIIEIISAISKDNNSQQVKTLSRLKKITLLLIVLQSCIVMTGRIDGVAAFDVNDHEEIAYYWAPVRYQETDNTNSKADYNEQEYCS